MREGERESSHREEKEVMAKAAGSQESFL